MDIRAAIMAVSALGLCGTAVITSCGQPFTAGAGGTGTGDGTVSSSTNVAATSNGSSGNGSSGNGSSGNGSSGNGSTTSTGSSSSSGTTGTPCDMTRACPAGQYCSQPDCFTSSTARGKCQPLPADGYNPVCGCDRATYWSAQTAAVNRTPVASGGVCAGTASTSCGPAVSLTNDPCQVISTHGYCNLGAADSTSCSALQMGTCWVLPDGCDGAGMAGRTCAATGPGMCTDVCTLIRNEVPWYMDTCTP